MAVLQWRWFRKTKGGVNGFQLLSNNVYSLPPKKGGFRGNKRVFRVFYFGRCWFAC